MRFAKHNLFFECGPTFEKKVVLCEAHLFDHDCDLYGQRLLVRLKSFLRPEQRFAGIDELLAQISVDADHARRILSDLHLQQLLQMQI